MKHLLHYRKFFESKEELYDQLSDDTLLYEYLFKEYWKMREESKTTKEEFGKPSLPILKKDTVNNPEIKVILQNKITSVQSAITINQRHIDVWLCYIETKHSIGEYINKNGDLGKANLIIEVLKDEKRHTTLNLFNLFKDSMKKGYTISLKLGKYSLDSFINIVNDKVNVKIIDLMVSLTRKHIETVELKKLLPLFIEISDDKDIIKWWKEVKGSKNLFKLFGILKDSDQYNKFNSIVNISGTDTAAALGGAGF